jgi:hypothetical protein
MSTNARASSTRWVMASSTGGRLGDSARVVVREDDGGGVVLQGLLDDFVGVGFT